MGTTVKWLRTFGNGNFYAAHVGHQLMRFQADILGITVSRNSSPDVSALGAAFLAGLATGIWSDLDQIAALPRQFDRFEPSMTESRRAELYRGWQGAVARARYQPQLIVASG